MTTKFQLKLLRDVDVQNVFFDSLRADYSGFGQWYQRKADSNERAYIYEDNNIIQAFLFLKFREVEEIDLQEKRLPAVPRIKISILKLDKTIQDERIEEGTIGLALWAWQKSDVDEVYIAIQEKEQPLIDLLLKFGFKLSGHKRDGECVYIKSKTNIDRSTQYTLYPYMDKNKARIGRVLPVYTRHHDMLFPYAKLSKTGQEAEGLAAANGISKLHIAQPYHYLGYNSGEPMFIYRISDRIPKKYNSAITSYCSIIDENVVKLNGEYRHSFYEYCDLVGNKTVYNESELQQSYKSNARNLIIINTVSNGFFGAGNTVNHDKLNKEGLWGNIHPYLLTYTYDQVEKLLSLGHQEASRILI